MSLLNLVVIIWRKSLNIWLTMQRDLNFFTIWLSKVLVIRRQGPHVIIDTQMTVEHEFKILTSSRWRFAVRSIQFSLVYWNYTQGFLITTRLWGRDSVGYYACADYGAWNVFKFKIKSADKFKINSADSNTKKLRHVYHVFFVMVKKPNIAITLK